MSSRNTRLHNVDGTPKAIEGFTGRPFDERVKYRTHVNKGKKYRSGPGPRQNHITRWAPRKEAA